MITEKWQILVNKDNIGIVGKYYSNKTTSSTYSNIYEYGAEFAKYLQSHNIHNICIIDSDKKTNRTFRTSKKQNIKEITTEQFLKIVNPPMREKIKKLVI